MMLASSGCTMLDLALGGGFPWGEIVNIVGSESAGKTFLATEGIYSSLLKFKKKLEWRYNDAERRYNIPTKNIYGFDIKIKEPSSTIEEFGDDVSNYIKNLGKSNKLIYVLDSLDSIPSEAEMARSEKRKKARKAGEETKGTYNLEKLQELGSFFRTKRKEIKNVECLLFVISQVRMNVGVIYGPRYRRTGGKALDHWASQIIWMNEVEKYVKRDRTIGVCIHAKVSKNSVGKPFRECFFDLLFDYGIDNISSNINFLYDLRTKKGKLKNLKEDEDEDEREVNFEKANKSIKLSWDEKEYTKYKLIQHIEDNNLEKELEIRTVKKWDEIEDAISSKYRKEKQKWNQ